MSNENELEESDIEYINKNANVKSYFEKLTNQNMVLNAKLNDATIVNRTSKMELEIKENTIDAVSKDNLPENISMSDEASGQQLDNDKIETCSKNSQDDASVIKKYLSDIKKLKSAVLILKDRNSKAKDKVKQKTILIKELQEKFDIEHNENSENKRTIEEIKTSLADFNQGTNTPIDLITEWQNVLAKNSSLQENDEKNSLMISELENHIIQLKRESEKGREDFQTLLLEKDNQILLIDQLKKEAVSTQTYIQELEDKIQSDFHIKSKLVKAIKKAKQMLKSNTNEAPIITPSAEKSLKPIHDIRCNQLPQILHKYYEKLISYLPSNFEKEIKMIVEYAPPIFSQRGKEFDAIQLLSLASRFCEKVKLFSKSCEQVLIENFIECIDASDNHAEIFTYLTESCNMINLLISLASRLKAYKKLINKCDSSIFYFLAGQYYYMIEREKEFDVFCVKFSQNRERLFIGFDKIINISNKLNDMLHLYFPEQVVQDTIKVVDRLDSSLFHITGIDLLYKSIQHYLELPHFAFLVSSLEPFIENIDKIKLNLVKILRGLKKSETFNVVFPNTDNVAFSLITDGILSVYSSFKNLAEFIVNDNSSMKCCPENVNEDSECIKEFNSKISLLSSYIDSISLISDKIHSGVYDNKSIIHVKENSFTLKLHEFKTKMYSDVKASEMVKEELNQKAELLLLIKEELKKKEIKIYELELTLTGKKAEIDGLLKNVYEITTSSHEDNDKLNNEISLLKSENEVIRRELNKHDKEHESTNNIKIFNDLITFSKIDANDFNGLRKLFYHERLSLHNLIDQLHKENCKLKAEHLNEEINKLNFKELKVKLSADSSQLLTNSNQFILESEAYLNRLTNALNCSSDASSLQYLLDLIKKDQNEFTMKFRKLEKDYLNSYDSLPLKNLFKYPFITN